MWPVGGAWLCQHLWEHYAFTGDRQFLKEYYPIMKGSAQFLLEVMVEEPKHHWLVTPFSMSPEHGYLDSNGKLAFLSPAPTMDVAIIRELFPHCIEASRAAGRGRGIPRQAGSRARQASALPDQPPGLSPGVDRGLAAGRSGAQLSRPTSPFYPGSSITLRGDPQLAAAIEKWMETRRGRRRLARRLGHLRVGATGARRQGCRTACRRSSRNSLASNLHNSGANQSDASFGFTAGVAEALLQSHAGEISLLPALPAGWSDGSVTGLRARGGFEVSMQWKDGKLQSAEIRHATGSECKLRYGAKTAACSVKPGSTVCLNADLATVN